jgi:hypothetical protein
MLYIYIWRGSKSYARLYVSSGALRSNYPPPVHARLVHCALLPWTHSERDNIPNLSPHIVGAKAAITNRGRFVLTMNPSRMSTSYWFCWLTCFEGSFSFSSILCFPTFVFQIFRSFDISHPLQLKEHNIGIIRLCASAASYCQRCFWLADFFTLMMEAIHSSETSVLTRATPCNTPEDGILYIIVICKAGCMEHEGAVVCVGCIHPRELKITTRELPYNWMWARSVTRTGKQALPYVVPRSRVTGPPSA